MQKIDGHAEQQSQRNACAQTLTIKVGIYSSCKTKSTTVYAWLTWGNSINSLQERKKLKALDRLAVRLTTNITRNTPQASAEIMIDLMSIELMIQKRESQPTLG